MNTKNKWAKPQIWELRIMLTECDDDWDWGWHHRRRHHHHHHWHHHCS